MVNQMSIYDIPKHNGIVVFKGDTTNRGEWLEHRVIGASSIHNLVEADRYKQGWIEKKPEYSSPWILYKTLKGEYEPSFSEIMQDKLEFGHFAEDFIRAKFPEKATFPVYEVIPGNEVIRHKKYEFATCTPDGWVSTDEGWFPMECKTGDSFQWEEWSGDTVPDKYYSQCQWILEVTGKEKMYILGWINNRFTKVFTVVRDQEFINYMFGLAKEFWDNFQNNIDPELVGNKVEAEALGIAYEIPKATTEKIKSDLALNLADELLNSITELKQVEEKAKPKAESIKIMIKKEMLEKGVSLMELGNGLIAKLNKRGALTIGG